MSLLSRRLLPGFFFAVVVALGLADPAVARAKDAPTWNWLGEADKARLLESIPPAPAKDSDQDRQDVAEVLKAQANRTADEIASAQADQHFSFELITRVLPPGFTRANYPVSYALLERVDDDEYLLNSTLKKRYQRLRPFQAHAEVKPLFEVEQFSYPSGHSSGSHVLATMLGKLFPASRADLEARADSVGRGRVVAGVHYPSDVEAGKTLAKALTEALLANPSFQKDLALAMMEVLQRKTAPVNFPPSAGSAAASP